MIKRNLIAVASAMLLASCGDHTKAPEETASADPFVRARTLKEVMANIVEVQAQVYWHSAGATIDASGEKDLTPTTDAGWLATRSAAATVSEMGNLLMTPMYAEGRGKDWIQFSKALVEIGKRAEKAAADKNGEAVFEVGGTMYNVCSACHQAYPPPVPATPAAANAAEKS
jgi:hypothetical protein